MSVTFPKKIKISFMKKEHDAICRNTLHNIISYDDTYQRLEVQCLNYHK